MATISKLKRRLLLLRSSSQIRYALTYVLITAVVLVFLNVYTASTTRDMMFRSKEVSLQGKVQLVVSSLAGLERLSGDNVAQVIALLGDLDANRVTVTDTTGKAVYDSLTKDNATGRMILFSEVVTALQGNVVFYCVYDGAALESRACMPIYNGSDQLIGSVYLMEYDTDLGAVIAALEMNLVRISLVLGTAIVLFSILFALIFSRRMRLILDSIQLLREGEYTHRIALWGHDEVGVLAEEFNKLTERLRTSEATRQQFVSDASHELKTPLASIKLLSDSILQNEMDMDTVREFVGDIGNEADRLTRIAQKLLELNRLEDAPKEDFVVMEPGPVVEKAVRLLTPLAQLRQIRLETKLDPDCTVVTRGDDIYQMAFNLVENAIKYNVDGGYLGVFLQRKGEDVVLTVEDSGIGIPEESLPYVFDRFYRVDKARSRQAGGSGLGLSIVHDLVERNYGTVTVEQREEGGTRFTLTFPFFGMEEET